MAPTTIQAPSRRKDILSRIQHVRSFGIFLKMLQLSRFHLIVAGRGPFTVFVPEDRAFYRYSREHMEQLLEDYGRLDEIVSYHIVPGSLTIIKMRPLRHARTIVGGSLVVEGCEGVRINGARIVRSDIMCANGVIHSVDDVLTPALVAE